MFKLTFLLVFLATTGFSAVEPDWQWRTFSTAHFDVIYDARNQELAEIYARYAEESLQQLAPYFKEKPERIVLVLNDSTDSANGFATRVPRPLIHLYPVLPWSGSSIGWYGNWSRELLMHELVHILSFEPAHGIYAPFRTLLGSIASPTMLLPRWWLEGVAVELETRLSRFGRLRSPYVESEIRAFTSENRIFDFDISLINELSTPDWPAGERPYLFGALVWHQMMLQLESPFHTDAILQSYSRRLPFLIQQPAIDQTQSNYQELLRKTQERVAKASEEQFQIIKSSELTSATAVRPLNDEIRTQTSPALSSDGSLLAFFESRVSDKSRIVILKRENDSLTEVFGQVSANGVSHLEWHETKNQLYYTKSGKRGYYGNALDLYSYDPAKKTSKRLTHQERVRQFDINSENKIIYTRAMAGRTQLFTFHTDTQVRQHVLTSRYDERLSHPVWLNSNTIAYVSRGNETRGHIRALDLATGDVQILLGPEWDITHLRQREGVLSFSSSKSGVPNIYSFKIGDSKPRALTNQLTGMFDNLYIPESTQRSDAGSVHAEGQDSAKVSNNSVLFASRMTGKGKELVQVLAPKSLESLPEVKPLLNDPWPKLKPSLSGNTEISPNYEYRAGPYLWPQYWIPFILPYEEGYITSAAVFGEDPLQRHRYSISLDHDTLTNQAGVSTSYTNSASSTPWTLSLYNRPSLIRGLNIRRTDTGGSLGVSFPLKNDSSSWSYSLGYSYVSSTTSETSASSLVNASDRSGPSFTLRYSDGLTPIKGRVVSSESGHQATLTTLHFPKATSRLAYNQARLSGQIFMSSFLPKRHVLSLSGKLIYTAETIHPIYGSSTSAAPSTLDGNELLLRGYLSGQFLGTRLLGSSLEYRFPLFNIHSGWGTFPLFLRRLHSRLVVDALTLDGWAIGSSEVVAKPFRRFFYGGGIEFYLNTTAAYSYPLSFYTGIYAPLSPEVSTTPRVAFFIVL